MSERKRSGPTVLLDGVDCLLLAAPLARALEEQSRRNGAVPERLAQIAEDILAGAREQRTLLGSVIRTSGFRDSAGHPRSLTSVAQWLTVDEVANALEVSTGFTRRLLRQRKLLGLRRGGRGAWLVDAASVAAYLNDRPLKEARDGHLDPAESA